VDSVLARDTLFVSDYRLAARKIDPGHLGDGNLRARWRCNHHLTQVFDIVAKVTVIADID